MKRKILLFLLWQVMVSCYETNLSSQEKIKIFKIKTLWYFVIYFIMGLWTLPLETAKISKIYFYFFLYPFLSLKLDFLFQEQPAQYCQNLWPTYPMFKFTSILETKKVRNIWKVWWLLINFRADRIRPETFPPPLHPNQ